MERHALTNDAKPTEAVISCELCEISLIITRKLSRTSSAAGTKAMGSCLLNAGRCYAAMPAASYEAELSGVDAVVEVVPSAEMLREMASSEIAEEHESRMPKLVVGFSAAATATTSSAVESYAKTFRAILQPSSEVGPKA